jgi:hypothetical protein
MILIRLLHPHAAGHHHVPPRIDGPASSCREVGRWRDHLAAVDPEIPDFVVHTVDRINDPPPAMRKVAMEWPLSSVATEGRNQTDSWVSSHRRTRPSSGSTTPPRTSPGSGWPGALREESGGSDGEELGQCDDLRLRQRSRSVQDGRDRRLRDSDLGLQLLLGQSV